MVERTFTTLQAVVSRMAAQQPALRRTYRERPDIFAEYDDAELLKTFRLDRAGIIAVTDMVRDKLQFHHHVKLSESI